MPLVPVSQRVGYTIEEVAEHNTAKSLWVIINRKVYDVTMFHKWHPGGASVLLQMGGKDATAAAAAAHKNALPANLMWEYCIGSIVRFKVAQEPAAAPRASVKAKAKAQSALKGRKPEQSQPSQKANAESPVQSAESSPRPSAANGMSSPRTESKESKTAEGSQQSAERGSSMAMGEGSGGGFLAATPQEDPQIAVKRYMLEFMEADTRLKSFFVTSNKEALDKQLSLFLAAAFDGAAWPQILVRRQVVEKYFPPLANQMWEGMRAPLPLGEDTLVAAVAALTKSTLAECDPPVAKLFEAIRDVLLFGPGSPASSPRSSPRAGPGTKIAALAGKWSTSDGSRVVVTDGVCTIDGKASHTLSMQGNLVAFNGYTTSSSLSGPSVLWKHSSGKKIEWYRSR